MAKNTIADLDTTAANNTDVLGQSTAGSATANTIDTIFQNTLGLVARAYGDIGGLGTIGGTADAITVTSLSTYQALESGLIITIKAGSANTGAATLNLDSLGVKKIRRKGDTALSANDIIANGRYILEYDAAYDTAAGAWVLMNPEITSLITAATQAEMEAASSTTAYASPGRVKYDPGVSKCWGFVTVSGGTPSVVVSQNTSSITDGGVGQYTITINTDFSSSSYAILLGVDGGASTTVVRGIAYDFVGPGSFGVKVIDEAASTTDPTSFSYANFGDQ